MTGGERKTMPDKEKVIKGLELLKDFLGDGLPGKRVVFNSYIGISNVAIILLKEQAWHLLKEDADGLIHGLPGDDGQYLMTDGEDIWIDDYVDGVDDGIQLDSGRDIREIKAWMYMPEPPKQEGR